MQNRTFFSESYICTNEFTGIEDGLILELMFCFLCRLVAVNNQC